MELKDLMGQPMLLETQGVAEGILNIGQTKCACARHPQDRHCSRDQFQNCGQSECAYVHRAYQQTVTWVYALGGMGTILLAYGLTQVIA